MGALGVDALVVTSAPNIRYLANHVGSAGIAVLGGDDAHLLVDFRYREAVQALQSSGFACPTLRVWDVSGSYDEALLGCLAEIGAARTGFESAHVTVARHDWWVKTIASRGLSVTLHSTSGVVERARLVKDAFELSTLRDAARRVGVVADAAIGAVRAGVTERAVAGAIESAMREVGYERPAFDTIVASGPHAALPHHRAGDRVLVEGDLVVLDFGGVLDGYCSDLTRTVSVGTPSDKARRLYEAVYEAHQSAVAAVRPGVTTAEIDAAARRVLEAKGLGEAFGHGTGHGLGLEVHEDPRVTWPRPDVPPVPVEPGMVFTIEPGAYLAGFGGVRIEDDVLVTDTGADVLTAVTHELLTR